MGSNNDSQQPPEAAPEASESAGVRRIPSKRYVRSMARRSTADEPVQSSRAYDPVQTVERLTEAGIDLFGRKGFHATSVREIVDSAGLTKGAFYHHFESKEDLLHMIHDEFIDFHLAGQRLIFEEVKTPHQRLYHLMRLLVFTVARYTSQVSVYFQEHKALAGDDFADVHAKRRAARDGFVQVIAAGMDDGEFRADMPPEMAAFAVLGMGNWIYQWYPDREGRPGWSAEEIGRSYSLMALRALTAKPRMVNALANRPLDRDDDPVLKHLER